MSKEATIEDIKNLLKGDYLKPMLYIRDETDPLYKNMRDIVRIKLDEGLTNEEILQYFQSKYGTSILSNPPKSGFYFTVWLVPIIVLPIIFLGLLFLIKTFINPPKDY